MEQKGRQLHGESVPRVRHAAQDSGDLSVSTLKADPNTPEEDTLDETNAQVHAALMALISNEAFDIVLWRRLRRCHNPGTSGRSRVLVHDMVSPPKCSIEILRHNIERLKKRIADSVRDATTRERRQQKSCVGRVASRGP